MDIVSNLMVGFAAAATAQNLFFCLAGCLLGTLIGVLPGIGPVATIAMLLPHLRARAKSTIALVSRLARSRTVCARSSGSDRAPYRPFTSRDRHGSFRTSTRAGTRNACSIGLPVTISTDTSGLVCTRWRVTSSMRRMLPSPKVSCE